MPYTLIVTVAALLLATYVGSRYIKLTPNVWKLYLAQPLAMASTPTIVVAANILAVAIAPRPELATLPITLTIIGTAISVVPAVWILSRWGRRTGTMFGMSLGMLGALFAGLAAVEANFLLLLVGSFLMGINSAFIAQLRFAALESVKSSSQGPLALSILMSSGLFSAILGPEIAVVAKDWVPSPHGFAGSFFVLAGFILLSILIIRTLEPIKIQTKTYAQAPRSLASFFSNPIFIVALCSGAIAYSVMSYLMTASPLSMHADHAYDMAAIKWVVQSHVLAMYVPSLFSALLVRWLGIRNLMLLGTFLYVLVIVVSLAGYTVMHYWVSMVLLGIGWNFLYLCGTLLLPEVYQPHERFKVQAVNDFGIFGIQAIASLSAGIILFSKGWAILVSITIPIIIWMLMVTLWYISIFKKQAINTD